MKIQRITVTVLLFIVVTLSATAQSKPTGTGREISSTKKSNLVGTWKFDLRSSTQNEIGRAISAKIINLESYLIIEQDGTKIIFVEKEQYEISDKPGEVLTKETKSTYYADGRGETNIRGIDYKTKTKWLGNVLVITDYSSGPPFTKKSEAVSRTTISISVDGKTLSRKFSIIANSKKEEKELAAFSEEAVYTRVIE